MSCDAPSFSSSHDSYLDCTHEEVILDDREGTEVCVCCGLVQDSNRSVGLSASDISRTQIQSRIDGKMRVGMGMSSVFASCDEIRDICANNCIPQCVQDYAIQLVYDNWNSKDKPELSRNPLLTAADALYRGFIFHDVPKTIQCVAAMCFVGEHELYASTSAHQSGIYIDPLKPSDISLPIFESLGITAYKDQRIVNERANAFYISSSCNSPPYAVLAVFIYFFVDRLKTMKPKISADVSADRFCNVGRMSEKPNVSKKGSKERFCNVSMPAIAASCNISLSCLRRLVHKMKRVATSSTIFGERPHQCFMYREMSSQMQ